MVYWIVAAILARINVAGFEAHRVLARPAASFWGVPAIQVVLKAGVSIKQLAGEAEGMFMDCERATLFSGRLVPSAPTRSQATVRATHGKTKHQQEIVPAASEERRVFSPRLCAQICFAQRCKSRREFFSTKGGKKSVGRSFRRAAVNKRRD